MWERWLLWLEPLPCISQMGFIFCLPCVLRSILLIILSAFPPVADRKDPTRSGQVGVPEDCRCHACASCGQTSSRTVHQVGTQTGFNIFQCIFIYTKPIDNVSLLSFFSKGTPPLSRESLLTQGPSRGWSAWWKCKRTRWNLHVSSKSSCSTKDALSTGDKICL